MRIRQASSAQNLDQLTSAAADLQPTGGGGGDECGESAVRLLGVRLHVCRNLGVLVRKLKRIETGTFRDDPLNSSASPQMQES